MSVVEGDLLAGKYRVERELARGGMGVVFSAVHTQLVQRVALKFLLPEGEADELSRLRFLREARAAVRLRSEHVARVLDVGTAEEGAPYIVMEYLEGQDLAEVLAERGRVPEAEAVSYILQAAEAVAEAHALGIIHRDLKPANLFLTQRRDGSPCVKVLDFGISKTLAGNSLGGGLTQTTAMVGTPHYMSPEQIRSSRTVDTRSDIWAMGMILYELVTGVVAFPRDTLPELCSAIILDPIPPPRLVAPDVSEALELAITVALAKAPENRPQSLAELAALLAPFTPDGPASADRIARVLRSETAGPSSQRMTSMTSSDPILVAAKLPFAVSSELPIGRADTEIPAPLDSSFESSFEMPLGSPFELAASSPGEASTIPVPGPRPKLTPSTLDAPALEPLAPFYQRSELAAPHVTRGRLMAVFGATVLLGLVGVWLIFLGREARAVSRPPPILSSAMAATGLAQPAPPASSAPPPSMREVDVAPPAASTAVAPPATTATFYGVPRTAPAKSKPSTAPAFDDFGPRQ